MMKEEKFREIYHQYYPLVRKVVYSILHDNDFSEDICQEVFILFSKKEDTLDETYYRQWFLVNAKRKAVDFCRKSYQVHETTLASSEGNEIGAEIPPMWSSCSRGSGNDLEEEVTHKLALQELTGRLFEDLARKNSDWYDIVMSIVVEGKDAEETAQSLGISMDNLRVKRHRIKTWMNKYYWDKYKDL